LRWRRWLSIATLVMLHRTRPFGSTKELCGQLPTVCVIHYAASPARIEAIDGGKVSCSSCSASEVAEYIYHL
jgi:hypothetical protein